MDENKALRFYEEPLFTWFLLVIYPPIGIVFLWGAKHYTIMVRMFISILFVLLFLNLLGLHRGFIRAVLFTLFLSFLEYSRQKINNVVDQSMFQYKSLQENEQISLIFRNYLKLYHKELGYLSGLVDLECMVETEYPLAKRIYGFNVSDYHYIKHVYKPLNKSKDVSNVKENIINYYNNVFSQLVELISKYSTFKSKRHASYVTLMLLRNKLVDYYANRFFQKYHMYFKHCFILKDYVQQFIEIKGIDVGEDSKDILSFTYYLIKQNCFKEDQELIECYDDVIEEINYAVKIQENYQFSESLWSLDRTIYEKLVTIQYVDDLIDGEAFEYFVAYLFEKKGYNATVTRNPDHGVDVILVTNEVRFGIQTKWYLDKRVGNEAVQEITAGLNIYKLTKGFVITNNYFTKSAKELAKANNITLWDRDQLIKEIKEAKLKVDHFIEYYGKNKK